MRLPIRKPGRWLWIAAPLTLALAALVFAWPRLGAARLNGELAARGVLRVSSMGGPTWLRSRFGDSRNLWFDHMRRVDFGDAARPLRQDELSALLARLHYFPHLTELHLTSTPVGDADLRCLADLPELRELELSGTEIGDGGLRWVGRCRQLRTLCLCGTRVTDAGLRHLAPLTHLRILLLDGTQVSDAGMAWLARHAPRLTDLSVSNTRVTDVGLQQLTARIPDLAVTDD